MCDQAEALAKTVLEQGEQRLKAQLQIALAADQRAFVAAGLLATAATAFLGVSVAAFGPEIGNAVLGSGCLVSAVVLAAGAVQCIRAARPVSFALIGSNPRDWWEDQVETRALAVSLRKQSNNYARRISENDTRLRTNAELLYSGLRLACISPLGLLGAFATQILPTFLL